MKNLLAYTPETFDNLEFESEAFEYEPLAGEMDMEEGEAARRRRAVRKTPHRFSPAMRKPGLIKPSGPKVRPRFPFVPPRIGAAASVNVFPPADDRRPSGQSSSSGNAGGEGSFANAPAQDISSEHVRWVQETLNRALGLRLIVDGIMNRETRSAVRMFQERKGLPVTGLVGPDTEEALRAEGGQEAAEPELLEGEWEMEHSADCSCPSCSGREMEEFGFEAEWQGETNEANGSVEAHELDPMVLDIAEKTIAREISVVEYEKPKKSVHWTYCFSAKDIAKVQKVYADNALAARAKENDRCSCIVMLNVALGQLLTLRLKQHPARSRSARRVHMGNLTTQSIELAMEQLRQKSYTDRPTVMNFLDRRGRMAGTLKPEKLKASVRDKVLADSKIKGCWFAFGMSIMDGYHSVLLLVNHTTAGVKKIYWLDQYTSGVNTSADVTNSLDQRLTTTTQTWWQAVMNGKGKGYNTMIRLWPIRKLST